MCRLLLQFLDLLSHLERNPSSLTAKYRDAASHSHYQVTHLLHLLSEGVEHLIAFSQGALKLLKLVHVQGELEDMTVDGYGAYCSDNLMFYHQKHQAYLLFQLSLLLLHQLTLLP